MDQSAQAQEIDSPSPADEYLKLRPSVSTLQENPSSSTQADSHTLVSADIMTNVLGSGDSFIHGFIYYDGYLWASTRTQPARILKIDPTTLQVDSGGRVELETKQDYGDDIVAAEGYIWVILYTNPAQLIRIDPTTLTADVAILFELSELRYGSTLQYAFGYLWAGGREKIARIDISEPLTPTFQIYDYSSLVIEEDNGTGIFTALTSSQNDLWGSMLQWADSKGYFSSTVVKIDPDLPTEILTSTISTIAPDDMTYSAEHLYISSEDSGEPSDIYQFASDLSTYTVTRAANSSSYGTFLNPLDPESLWGVYIGSPGIIKKFDLSPAAMVTNTLPVNFDDPNELAFDESGNMYVTTWTAPAGIVKYPAAPSVSDLSIRQSGSDVVLSWEHLGGNVTYYQVWRSTERSFSPGDDLSIKIGEVIPLESTITFTDPDAAEETAYYVVKSVNGYGLVSPASNEVSLASTTTTISSHLPNPSTVGQLVTITYSVTSSGGTPSGNVTVSDGTDSCTGTVAAGGCSITFLSKGTKTLVATYEGDENFDSSVSVGVTHVVNEDSPSKADTTTVIISHTPNPSGIGEEVTITYAVTSDSGTPSGNVMVSDGTDNCTGTVADGGCSIIFLSSGLKTLVAIYQGDENFNSSFSPGVTHVVTEDTSSKADTTTVIISHTPNPSKVGQVVNVSYNVASVGGTPTGDVVVSDGTESCTGTVHLGICSLSFSSVGTKKLIAIYVGDSDFNSSISAEVSHTVEYPSLYLPIITYSIPNQ
jgi:hypothetical protein